MVFGARVAAAVDFGTYGTGFAWTPISDDNAEISSRTVHLYTGWQEAPTGVTYPKNLSSVLLDADGTVVDWGYSARRRWINSMRPEPSSDVDYYTHFKMSLQPAAGGARRTNGSRPTSAASLGAADGQVEALVTACLKRVYEVALDNITGGGIYEPDDIRWCVTVPAIWSDYTRSVMRRAAVAAGLPAGNDRLLLAVEPEVAALHCFHDRAKAGMPNVGTVLVVVDAGGGTVDLTSYRIADDGGLRQLALPSGDKVGAEYLDKAFHTRILEPRLGADLCVQAAENRPLALQDLREAWDRAKRQYKPGSRTDLHLNLPTALDRMLDDTTRRKLAAMQGGIDEAIVVSPQQMDEIFATACSAIGDLVDGQLDAIRGELDGQPPVAALVGGFGASDHLRDYLTEHLRGRATLVRPPDPEAAVLRGAVHFAYDPGLIGARRAPLTYGVGMSAIFEVGVDPDEMRFTDDYGDDLCRNRFKVFVSANEEVSADRPVTHTFYSTTLGQTEMSCNILCTPSPTARYTTEPGMQSLGTIRVRRHGTEDPLREEWSVAITFNFSSTEIIVSAIGEHTGEPVNVTVNYTPTWGD